MDAQSGALSLEQLERDYEGVLVAGADMQGRLLGRRLPASQFVAHRGVDICSAALSWDVSQSAELGLSIAGFHTGWHDWRLDADLTTLRRAAWLPDTAFCMADFVDERTGVAVPVAPRTILRSQAEGLAARGLSAEVATELEFYLYRTGYREARAARYHGLEPTTPARSDYSIRALDEHEGFFSGLRAKARASGLEVGASQAEWGRGQWECNLAHLDPLAAADQHSLLKLLVREHAAAEGFAATFMARPHADDVGSSCHIHLSLRGEDGHPVFHDDGAPDAVAGRMRAALGGLLDRLPEAMVWYAPTINAYGRTRAAGFAGRGRTWGFDNRTVSVRVAGRDPASLRLELRVPGADANPYLALAAVLAAVQDGLDRDSDPGPPFEGDAYAADLEPLPGSLAAAVQRFSESAWARRSFGDAVVDHYADALAVEIREFEQAVTDWELLRYFEEA